MAERTADGTYRKLPVKQFAPRTIRETAEGRYWKAYKAGPYNRCLFFSSTSVGHGFISLAVLSAASARPAHPDGGTVAAAASSLPNALSKLMSEKPLALRVALSLGGAAS